MTDASVPDRDALRAVAASLGNRANALAAEGRVAEVPALWEDAIAGVSDPASRALITLAYAWYQVLHGQVEHGIRLAAGLRACAVPSVRQQVRVVVRNRARVGSAVVGRTWQAVTGERLPAWAFLADEDIDAVADWVSAPSWAESEALYGARVRRIPPEDADEVLEEMVLGDARLCSAVAVHRALLTLGGDAGYRAVGDLGEAAGLAGAAIAVGDWAALRACGTIEMTVHGRAFLGAVHGVAAEMMAAGGTTVSPAVAERVGVLARRAQPWERGQARTDLSALGDASVLTLLVTVPDSPAG